jgi:GTPase Era involved in 16S rRNA processing
MLKEFSIDNSNTYVYTVEKLKETINTFRIESLRRELNILENYLSENGSTTKYIDVAILGQFKAGKSSLINDLLDENILPTGVIPVTSIVTRLQYSDEKNAIVHFLDGRILKTDLAEVKNFITELNNPKNVKQVEIVDIYLPQLYKFQTIRLIDTPGIGSFFKHNSDMTMKWLPEVGLALIAISVERPLGEEDLLLLKVVQRHAVNTQIILTKSDLISSEQIKQVKDYILDSLKNEGLSQFSGSNNLIFTYSIRKDIEQNRKRLIENIFYPLEENHLHYFEKIIRHKKDALLQSCLSYLRIGLESASKTESERKNLKDLIISEQLKFQTVKNELNIISDSLINKNRDVVEDVVMLYLMEYTQRLVNDYQEEYDKWHGNLYKVSREFESWLENKLKEILIECGEKAIIRLNDYLRKIQDHYSNFASSFSERLNHNVEKVLGVKLDNIELQLEVEKIDQPDTLVSSSFDIHIDLIWFLFPMFIFKKIFRKFFMNKIPYEVEKNLSRLTSDIAENIRKEIDWNKQLVTQYIQNELLSIENIINNQKHESSYFVRAIEEMEALK